MCRSLRQRPQTLEQQHQQHTALHARLAQRLSDHQQQRPAALSDADAGSIAARLEQLRVALRDNARQQGKRSSSCSDTQQRQQQQTLLAQIAADEAELTQLSRLNDPIGSAKGDKFRRFAQGLTLDHLVWLVNRQLDRLHGRYSLQRRVSDELELEVVDTGRPMPRATRVRCPAARASSSASRWRWRCPIWSAIKRALNHCFSTKASARWMPKRWIPRWMRSMPSTPAGKPSA